MLYLKPEPGKPLSDDRVLALALALLFFLSFLFTIVCEVDHDPSQHTQHGTHVLKLDARVLNPLVRTSCTAPPQLRLPQNPQVLGEGRRM